jgi:hypothetical protein
MRRRCEENHGKMGSRAGEPQESTAEAKNLARSGAFNRYNQRDGS